MRVTKILKLPTDRLKKKKPDQRLNEFWNFVIENVRLGGCKIDVSKVRVGEDLAKLLNKNPWDWLAVGPAENPKIVSDKKFYKVEICSGFKVKEKR